ncbi:retrovirus-related pol polyprotein from transposon TNT 1-94 [Tanacetum coccineum]
MIPKPGDADREVPVNETFHEQTDDELTEIELKQVEADDQAIQTILLGLPEDIYDAVDSCETAQEIWLRVQQMMKVQNSGIQNVRNQNGLIVVSRIANQNGNGNVVAAWDEGNENGNNGNQIRCYNYRGLGHLARNCTVRPRRRDAAYLQTQMLIAQKEEAGIQLQAEEFDLMAAAVDLDKIEEVNKNCILIANLQQASTSGTQTDKAPVYDLDRSAEQAQQKQQSLYNGKVLLEKHDPPAVYDSEETLQLAQESRIHKIVKDEIFPIVNQVNARVQNFKIQFLKEAKKIIRDFKSLAKEADESLAKHKALELEIERLLRAVVSQDIMSTVQNNSVVDTSNLKTELELTSNSVSTPIESKVVENDNVIAPGMFRIDPCTTSREDKFVPINKVRARVRTNLITASQPHVITKKIVNSDSNGFSSTGVDITTKTRRSQSRSNTKNDRVSSASNSSRI